MILASPECLWTPAHMARGARDTAWVGEKSAPSRRHRTLSKWSFALGYLEIYVNRNHVCAWLRKMNDFPVSVLLGWPCVDWSSQNQCKLCCSIHRTPSSCSRPLVAKTAAQPAFGGRRGQPVPKEAVLTNNLRNPNHLGRRAELGKSTGCPRRGPDA